MVLFGAHTKETVQRVGYMSAHSGPPLQSRDTFMCIRRSIPWVDTTYRLTAQKGDRAIAQVRKWFSIHYINSSLFWDVQPEKQNVSSFQTHVLSHPGALVPRMH